MLFYKNLINTYVRACLISVICFYILFAKVCLDFIQTYSNLTYVESRIIDFNPTRFWVDAPLGLSMYHYEGENTTEYNLPSPFVEIFVVRYGFHRGIAFAVDWRNDQNHQLYVNTLHDAWAGWLEK